jgi:hypothetical protein
MYRYDVRLGDAREAMVGRNCAGATALGCHISHRRIKTFPRLWWQPVAFGRPGQASEAILAREADGGPFLMLQSARE